jgi:hypothetical protein
MGRGTSIGIIIFLLIFAARSYLLSVNPVFLNNKAVRLHDKGNTKEAIATLEKIPESKRTTKIQANLDVFRQEQESVEHGNELKTRAEQRIRKMIDAGWKDDNASLQVTMDAAFASFQIGNNKDAIVLYERALFKKPGDMELEQKIEDIEAQMQKEAMGKK